EDRFPIVDILQQTPPIPETTQWAMFLRNHDELTLEMVTDEERDYMYRVYAADAQARINLGIRRRLAPLLGNDRRKIELMMSLLFAMPGTPVIYYGDEIGMGDNIYVGDRNGVRTPMQWSADRNAGFSRAPSQRLYLPVNIDPDYHYETVNVEARQNNPSSALWYMKRLLSLRKRFQAFGRGTIEFLYPENPRVLAFIRSYEEEMILVVANLSRFSQFVELDLSAFQGRTPVELFGQTEFPVIKEQPYFLTLGPHAFYWFALEKIRLSEDEIGPVPEERKVPVIALAGSWEHLFRQEEKGSLEKILPDYLKMRRWFGGKARRIKSTAIRDAIPLPGTSPPSVLALAQVDYTEGDPEFYNIPLVFASGERSAQVQKSHPHAVVARLTVKRGNNGLEGIVYDAFLEHDVCDFFLQAIGHRRRFKGNRGEVVASPTRAFRRLRGAESEHLPSSLSKAEQSNTSVFFGDRLILKLIRKLDEGQNPDLEIGAFLTDKARFPHIPPVAGALEYRRNHEESMTLAILQGFVPNQGDAWKYTLDYLGRFYERALSLSPEAKTEACPKESALMLVGETVPELAADLIGTYLVSARQMGQRTAEMHVALASDVDNPAFAPESFSAHYQRALYQSMRNLTSQTLPLLQKRLRSLPEAVREEAKQVLDLQDKILKRFRSILDRKITAMRIRVHGDYHLGQVLFTGKDFVIIDFEGEPARSLSSRRIKRSPLRDVAGMLRSFHYAANAPFIGKMGGGGFRLDDSLRLEPWAHCWTLWVSAAFLSSYLGVSAQASFLPKSREELSLLLSVYLLEKSIYELGYELNNRPDWVKLPLRGILQLLETAE
ncbi:MAG TPA: putative maltokinase, partial [Candidatus Limnocylindria bacterium]|nr:putative maltokinase [Candidatus Limnocylindria bacterium]